MILQNTKISHKLIFMTVTGLVIIGLFACGIVLMGKDQIDAFEDIYNTKLVPLDNLRNMQLIFREIDYQMVGVISSAESSEESGKHLRKAVKRLAGLWTVTKEKLSSDKILPHEKRFEEALVEFGRMAGQLQAAYDKDDIDAVDLVHERWLDLKPIIFKTIDTMAEIQKKEVNAFYITRNRTISKVILAVIFISILSALFFLAFAFMIIRSINKPIRTVVEAAVQVAGGDLTHTVRLNTGDEMGKMAAELNKMLANLRDAFCGIAKDVETTSSHAERLSGSSEALLSNTEQQRSQVEQVVAASTEMSQTILDMAKNAADASEATKDSYDMARTGKEVVHHTVDSITRLADSVGDASRTIENLGKSSKEIGEIVSVIQDIADQTNLLALNAAIEAARAGDQGRGFAVVADEVRKLAEKTARATEDIAEKIKAVQVETKDSVSVMEMGKSLAEETVSTAREAEDALRKIVESSDRVMDMVRRIATATEEQSSASEQVSQSMEHISGVISDIVRLSEEVRGSASELSSLSQAVRKQIRCFKTDGNGNSEAARISEVTGVEDYSLISN
ncbi:methyl-accepting chemotaxis protein McpS [bacterium BMS3Bbin06]|nr:methyl-accepting chemotaxis protein McpS [bacterium BMS3Bbin06]